MNFDPAMPTITDIRRVEVNNQGSWFALVSSGNDDALIRNGTVLVKTGDMLPVQQGSLALGSIEQFSSNNLNNVVISCHLQGATSTTDQAVYFLNGTLPTSNSFAIQEGVTQVPSSATVFKNGAAAFLNDTGDILVLSNTSGAAVDYVAARYNVDQATGQLNTSSVLVRTGDPVPGYAPPAAPNLASIDASSRGGGFANGVHFVMHVGTTAGPGADNAVTIGTTTSFGAVAYLGQAIPGGGSTWSSLSGISCDVNSGGSYTFDGVDSAGDVVLISSASGLPAVFARTGDPLPAMISGTIAGFGVEAFIDDAGEVLWRASWAASPPGSALFVGQDLAGSTVVAQKGVTTTGGQVIFSLTDGDQAYSISRNGRYVVLLGAVGAPTPEHLMMLDRRPFDAFCAGDGSAAACPCANSGAVGHGCANSVNPAGALLSVVGTASLASDSAVLQGTDMPNSTAIFLQSTVQSNGGLGNPIDDGLNCMAGSIVRLATKTIASGAAQYPDTGDAALHIRGNVTLPGVRHYQVYYRNSAVFCTPATSNRSNGVSVLWEP